MQELISPQQSDSLVVVISLVLALAACAVGFRVLGRRGLAALLRASGSVHRLIACTIKHVLGHVDLGANHDSVGPNQ